MKLSKNFDLEEFTISYTALKLEIDNTPSKEIIDNIQHLVDNVLQPLRDAVGRAIHINSGYRSPALNKAVGGSPKSQHLSGLAADITLGSKEANRELYEACKGLDYDQLIDEYNFSWVHISYNPKGNRKQQLKIG